MSNYASFFSRENHYKKKGICPTCRGKGKVGGQFTSGKIICPYCNGRGTYKKTEDIFKGMSNEFMVFY